MTPCRSGRSSQTRRLRTVSGNISELLMIHTIHPTHVFARNGVEQSSSIPGANCRRRWHGTARMCKLGNDDQSHSFCSSHGCSLCRIIQVRKIRRHTSFSMIERMADLFPVDQSWSVYKLWPIRRWYIYIRYFKQGSYESTSYGHYSHW